MAFFIYRIETRNKIPKSGKKVGYGCYASSFFSKKGKMTNQHEADTHPSIRDDVGSWYRNEGYYEECFCAFRNMKSLEAWFEGWLEHLFQDGFVVMRYRVTSFVPTKSKKQIMFHPDNILSNKEIMSKLKIV